MLIVCCWLLVFVIVVCYCCCLLCGVRCLLVLCYAAVGAVDWRCSFPLAVCRLVVLAGVLLFAIVVFGVLLWLYGVVCCGLLFAVC